ncbi:MAG: homoserine kinase [Myxococcota bacterium]
MSTATVFAPGTIGNVGPGFDVLGLCVDGIGDEVTVELVDAPAPVVAVTGRDAEVIPIDPTRNAAAIAAQALLRRVGSNKHARVSIKKGLPMSGGMGGSAASSVGGALAAARAWRTPVSDDDVVQAALAGESAVAGRHLDNIAPCLLGGLSLVLSVDPVDMVRLEVKRPWWVALVSPAVRVETKAARAVLPRSLEQHAWVKQMAHTSALVAAFSRGDAGLVRRALNDGYAEPARASLIPHFHDVKRAALGAGALGCSISGAGPTVFALAEDERGARDCASAMQRAFSDVTATTHVGPICKSGAREVKS